MAGLRAHRITIVAETNSGARGVLSIQETLHASAKHGTPVQPIECSHLHKGSCRQLVEDEPLGMVISRSQFH